MEAMNDGLTYALVFGIVFLGGLLIVLIVRLVFDIRERIKQKDIDDLRLKCKELKVEKDAAIIKAANLTAENIVLRGLNAGLAAENKELHGANADLMAIAQNEYNHDFGRVLWNILQLWTANNET